ncbi:hypothetical protein ACHAXT_011441 [Thalassiosira profunda]
MKCTRVARAAALLLTASSVGAACADDADESCSAFEPADVAFCRRRPDWGDVRSKCQEVMEYEPDEEHLVRGRHPHLSSTFDSTETSEGDDYDALPVMERPLMKRIAECMSEAHISSGSAEDTDDEMPSPAISKLHRRLDGLPVMGIVSNALNEEEARSVHALSICLQTHAPTLFERRRFEQTYEGGGNDVTFMAGFLQIFAPGVAIQLRRVLHLVWKEAGWGDDEDFFEPIDLEYDDEDEENESAFSTRWWPDPMDKTVGIRTTEHLSYSRWNGLGYHEDSGSDYTVLVGLSDPADYEGGEFSFFPEYDNEDRRNSNDEVKIEVKPERLSAIVFLSNFRHGVEEIRSPGRMTFANEFWRYGDVPAMQQRPNPEYMVFGDEMNGFELDEEIEKQFDSEDEEEGSSDEDSSAEDSEDWDSEDEDEEYAVY